MNCAELRMRLEGYADGTLPADEARALELHLADCAACSALLEQLEGRSPALAGLARSVEPADDLWPGIQARLAPRGRRISLPSWALAAAAVLLIALSSGVTALLLRHSPPPAQISASISPLETQYAAAAADLGAALEQARSRLSPETIATIMRNLAVIDSALAESRQALARDPGNTSLEQLVIVAWRQKMDFLRRATALSSES